MSEDARRRMEEEAKKKAQKTGIKPVEKTAEEARKEVIEQAQIAPPSIPGIKPTKPKRPTTQTITLINLPVLSENLYETGNFPTIEQNIENLKILGLAGKTTFRPKTATEALSRLGYAATQAIIGAGEEAVFPFKPINTPIKRPQDQVLRISGGVLTPTPIDYAATYVLSKLGVTQLGKKIIKKIYGKIDDFVDPFNIPDSFTLEEARQWEKIVGNSGISTADLRKLDADNVKIFKRIEDIAEFYDKNKDLYTAGAHVIPEEVILLDDFLNDVGWEPDEFINFLDEFDETLNLDSSLVTSILTRLDAKQTKDAVITLDRSSELSDSIMKEIDETISEQEIEVEREEVIPGGLSLREDQIIEEITETKPKTKTIQVQEQEPVQITEPITEEVLTEEVLTEEITPVSSIPFKLKSKTRQAINLQLYRGRKQKYRVQLKYSDGTKTSVTFDARSHPEAIAKAENIPRRGKTLIETLSERVQ